MKVLYLRATGSSIVNHVNSVNHVKSVSHVKKVNSVTVTTACSAVLPPSRMVFFHNSKVGMKGRVASKKTFLNNLPVFLHRTNLSVPHIGLYGPEQHKICWKMLTMRCGQEFAPVQCCSSCSFLVPERFFIKTRSMLLEEAGEGGSIQNGWRRLIQAIKGWVVQSKSTSSSGSSRLSP